MLEKELGIKNKLFAAETSFWSANLPPSSLGQAVLHTGEKSHSHHRQGQRWRKVWTQRETEQTGKGVSWAFFRFAGIKVVLVEPEQLASLLFSTGFSPLPSHLNHLLSVICFYIQRFKNKSFPQGNSKLLAVKASGGHKE